MLFILGGRISQQRWRDRQQSLQLQRWLQLGLKYKWKRSLSSVGLQLWSLCHSFVDNIFVCQRKRMAFSMYIAKQKFDPRTGLQPAKKPAILIWLEARNLGLVKIADRNRHKIVKCEDWRIRTCWRQSIRIKAKRSSNWGWLKNLPLPPPWMTPVRSPAALKRSPTPPETSSMTSTKINIIIVKCHVNVNVISKGGISKKCL